MKLSVSVTKMVVLVATLALLSSCVSKKKYDEAMTRSAAEKSALESELAAANEETTQLQSEFDQLQQNLNMSKEEIAELSETIKANNQKIATLQTAITEAFSTYDKDDITVEERSGKLYITMANSILFEAGRDRLTKDSKEVIETLAGVFKDNGDMMIMVEGHTDSDPVRIHKNQYKDNWSLSVARSLSVVRQMEEVGVNADRMTASGKGETQPIASNDTDEGKMKNRRTEFIVSPAIEGLYKMYENDFENLGSSK